MKSAVVTGCVLCRPKRFCVGPRIWWNICGLCMSTVEPAEVYYACLLVANTAGLPCQSVIFGWMASKPHWGGGVLNGQTRRRFLLRTLPRYVCIIIILCCSNELLRPSVRVTQTRRRPRTRPCTSTITACSGAQLKCIDCLPCCSGQEFLRVCICSHCLEIRLILSYPSLMASVLR